MKRSRPILKLSTGEKPGPPEYVIYGARSQDRCAEWATFGKQNWRCGMNRTPGRGAQR